MAEGLDALESSLAECSRCSLAEGRTNVVFGVGDPHARVMFIGEAPGKNEDLKGEPFVGAAGRLLDELLGSIGLRRSDVYIANILKCRPPGNRDPLPAEVGTCTPFLEEQVALIDPTVIVPLGRYATKHVLGTERGISTLRGRLFDVAGRRVVPMFHPAVALYDPRQRQVLVDDFKRLDSVLRRCAAAEGSGSEQDGGGSTPDPCGESSRELEDVGVQLSLDGIDD